MRNTIKCMTKCYLDSNFLIFFKNTSSPNFSLTGELLIKFRREEIPIFVSPLCLDEFVFQFGKHLRVAGSKNFYSDQQQALKSILNLPNLSVINPPTHLNSQLEIINLMQTFSLQPRDAYHLLTMQANQIDGFATFDHDFDKVFKSKLLIKA